MRRPLAAALGAVLVGVLGIGVLAPAGSAPAATPGSTPAPAERDAILALGPWPAAPARDAANPASGNPAGIALGEALFHSPRLSPTGLRCASCHEPWRGFADGRPVAPGVAAGSRNTPSLLDAARHRHFGWDGARDALWEQSLRPLRDAREMPASDAQVATLVRGDPALAARHAQVFGGPPSLDDARVTREVGQALAAYVETLASPRTAFDDWRDRLARTGEASVSNAFPASALRGLRLFVGAAGCSACHAGSAFTDDALHASLVHSLTADGAPDPGHAGTLPNAFRTPGLRGAIATGPWFHDGSAGRLCDAIQPHATDGAGTSVALDAAQRRDLVAFLRTLSAASADGVDC